MMKKVLFVASIDQHIRHHHLDFLELLKSKGCEVHVASHGHESFKYVDKKFNVPFQRNPYKISNVKALFKLKKIINSNKYDIIHCHTPVGGVITRIVSKRARKNGSLVIYTAHGFHFYKGAPVKYWLLYYPIENWLSNLTDVMITINQEDYQRAKNSFKTKRIEYINGVGLNTGNIGSVMVDKLSKRKELGIPKDALVLLSIGELNKNKNHEAVIKAIAELNMSNLYYIICGKGILKSYLTDLVSKLGLDNQIKLLGYRNDIFEICKISDIFVFPSYREGLSAALMQSMASGLPVICSNIRGNTDLIEDGKGGYLANPNNKKDFRESINILVNDSLKRKNFGDYNKTKIAQFDTEVVLDKLEKIYFDSKLK